MGQKIRDITRSRNTHTHTQRHGARVHTWADLNQKPVDLHTDSFCFLLGSFFPHVRTSSSRVGALNIKNAKRAESDRPEKRRGRRGRQEYRIYTNTCQGFQSTRRCFETVIDFIFNPEHVCDGEKVRVES